ncbi:hypothetical protein C1645_818925 [Glomus cerebriforme]|uniref:Uncharacterized protein n=1 Tax=Glomus cerebriforme TaxID=658196 RepID=A0A397TFQ2_9GLOM|nr:hypothetical protein C1645_818925 [Glomus cerebriforme]
MVTPKENAKCKVWISIIHASHMLKISVSHILECCSNEEWREIEINLQKFNISSLRRVQLTNGLITRGCRILQDWSCLQIPCSPLVTLAFFPKEEASNHKWYISKENTQHAVCTGLNPTQHAVKQMFDDGSFQEFLSLAKAQYISLRIREYKALLVPHVNITAWRSSLLH